MTRWFQREIKLDIRDSTPDLADLPIGSTILGNGRD
jgi:hypothetical protein